jgi:hypothetical protein
MELSGIYPESVEPVLSYPVSFSPVAYHEGVPAFTVSFVSADERNAAEPGISAPAADVLPALRKIITETGCAMIQESAGQGELKFYTPQANFKALMERLEEFRADVKIAITEFSLCSRGGGQKSGFDAVIAVVQKPQTGSFSFEPFTEFPALFIGHSPKPQIKAQITRSTPVSYTKIGVIQEGGKKCIFYRTIEGKIIRIEE